MGILVVITYSNRRAHLLGLDQEFVLLSQFSLVALHLELNVL